VKKTGEKQYVSPYNVAAVYAALGEKDLAFVWLEKAYSDQSENIPVLKYDPLMKDLRPDPRLTDILRRAGQTP
jgi:eukaryotic-like serine/threonine-protein kinase